MAILHDLTSAFAAPAASAPATKAQAQSKSSLNWQTLDITTLSPDLQALYSAYKSAEAVATSARKTFEAAMTTKLDLPSHITLRFAYRYGLGVALDTSPAKARTSTALTLEGLSGQITASSK